MRGAGKAHQVIPSCCYHVLSSYLGTGYDTPKLPPLRKGQLPFLSSTGLTHLTTSQECLYIRKSGIFKRLHTNYCSRTSHRIVQVTVASSGLLISIKILHWIPRGQQHKVHTLRCGYRGTALENHRKVS